MQYANRLGGGSTRFKEHDQQSAADGSTGRWDNHIKGRAVQ